LKEALMIRLRLALLILLIFVLGFLFGQVSRTWVDVPVNANTQKRVFEIRTYTTNEGKLDALHARFRNHTMKLFEKHGMTNIGYWSLQDKPMAENTLIYVLAHSNRDAAKKSWEGFRNDPEWKKVQMESEANGKIVSKVESVFMEPTDYSPMK
jgi:hypothetical protein